MDNLNIQKEYVFLQKLFHLVGNQWCIEREGLPKVINWFNSNTTTGRNYNEELMGWYSHYPAMDGNNHTRSRVTEDYTEITFEQFKKYVLKEDIEINSSKRDHSESKIVEKKKLFTIEDARLSLSKHYDKDDVDDILQIIEKNKH